MSKLVDWQAVLDEYDAAVKKIAKYNHSDVTMGARNAYEDLQSAVGKLANPAAFRALLTVAREAREMLEPIAESGQCVYCYSKWDGILEEHVHTDRCHWLKTQHALAALEDTDE